METNLLQALMVPEYWEALELAEALATVGNVFTTRNIRPFL